MRIHFLLPLSLVAACAAPPPQPAQAPPEQRVAQYEVQVEEGFGHLDRVPADWARLPH